MTADLPVTVRVRYRDAALATLVVHAARGVEGVVRLQRRPVRGLGRRRGEARDVTAVELDRDADGTLDVSVRLVSRLTPAPKDVMTDVATAVRAQLAVVGESGARVVITVTDVQR